MGVIIFATIIGLAIAGSVVQFAVLRRQSFSFRIAALSGTIAVLFVFLVATVIGYFLGTRPHQRSLRSQLCFYGHRGCRPSHSWSFDRSTGLRPHCDGTFRLTVVRTCDGNRGLTKRCRRRLLVVRPRFIMIKTVPELISPAPGSRG